jgi:putative transposase
MTPVKRTPHAVYDTKYHLVWIPKYRKKIFSEIYANRLKEIFHEISEQYEFEIDTMEVMRDHVHIFLSAPPRYSAAKIVNILKGASSRTMFNEFPELKRHLLGGELWSDGYFVRAVGDKLTTEVIKRYIQYHNHDMKQLSLFESD